MHQGEQVPTRWSRDGVDDTNVMLLVANPAFGARTVSAPAATRQVAPTIVKALGLKPETLDAVRAEGTQVLSEVWGELTKKVDAESYTRSRTSGSFSF